MSGKPWFKPKRYGYGAGLPIAWQGWVVLIVYLAVTVGAAPVAVSLFPNVEIAAALFTGVIMVASVVLLIICARKTEGGWHWRWGKRD